MENINDFKVDFRHLVYAKPYSSSNGDGGGGGGNPKSQYHLQEETKTIRITGIPSRKHVSDSRIYECLCEYGSVECWKRKRDKHYSGGGGGGIPNATQAIVTYATPLEAIRSVQGLKGFEMSDGASLNAYLCSEKSRGERLAAARREAAERNRQVDERVLEDYRRARLERRRRLVGGGGGRPAKDDEKNGVDFGAQELRQNLSRRVASSPVSPWNAAKFASPISSPSTSSPSLTSSSSSMSSLASPTSLKDYLMALDEALDVRSTFAAAFGPSFESWFHEQDDDDAADADRPPFRSPFPSIPRSAPRNRIKVNF